MAQPVKDPALVKRLLDAFDIANAGGDPNVVMRSNSYKERGLQRGMPNVQGTRGQSFFQGMVGNPAEAIAQALASGSNWAARKLGIDTSGSGFGSDAEAAYGRIAPKVMEDREAASRQMQGRGGVDIANMAGSLFTPIPGGVGGPVARAAMQGAGMSVLQPVTDPEQNLLAAKAAQGTVGAGTGALFGLAGNAIANRAKGAMSRSSEAQATYDAMKRLGLEDEAGIGFISPNRVVRSVTDVSSNLPGGGRLVKQGDRLVDNFEHITDQTAANIGPGKTIFDAGNAIQKGSRQFLQSFRNTADKLYGNVNTHVDPQFSFLPNQTFAAMSGRADNFDNQTLGKLLQNPRLKMFASAMLGQTPEGEQFLKQMTFKDAQQLRSEVGRMMGNSELINDIPRKELSTLYGAISNDMKDALVQAGNTKGLNAFNRASRYWSAGQKRVDGVIEHVIGEGVGPESAAQRVTNWVQKNSNNVASLRRSIPNDQWDIVASSIFRRLGEATPANQDRFGEGASIVSFLKDYNTLRQNKRAFDFAFGGTRYAQLKPVYDDIAHVAEGVRRGAILANRSRTAYAGGMIGLLGATVTHPAFAAQMIGANLAWANLMARPTFAKWYLQALRITNKANRGLSASAEAAMRAHVERLPAIAMSSPDEPTQKAISNLYNYFISGGSSHPQEEQQ